MSREWDRGRLARIAGKPRTANPHRPPRYIWPHNKDKAGRAHLAWLAGWLYQDERQRSTGGK